MSMSCNPLSVQPMLKAGVDSLVSQHVNDKSLGMTAVLILAFLVGMAESGKCAMQPAHVQQLLDAIKATMAGNDYSGVHYSLWKLLFGLSKLAVNERNKTRLHELGVLEILSSVLKLPSDDKAVEHATATLWQLAFCPSVRQAIVDDRALFSRTRQLMASTNATTKQNAQGLMFTLRGMKPSSKGDGPARNRRREDQAGALPLSQRAKPKRKGNKTKEQKKEKKKDKKQNAISASAPAAPPPAAPARAAAGAAPAPAPAPPPAGPAEAAAGAAPAPAFAVPESKLSALQADIDATSSIMV